MKKCFFLPAYFVIVVNFLTVGEAFARLQNPAEAYVVYSDLDQFIKVCTRITGTICTADHNKQGVPRIYAAKTSDKYIEISVEVKPYYPCYEDCVKRKEETSEALDALLSSLEENFVIYRVGTKEASIAYKEVFAWKDRMKLRDEQAKKKRQEELEQRAASAGRLTCRLVEVTGLACYNRWELSGYDKTGDKAEFLRKSKPRCAYEGGSGWSNTLCAGCGYLNAVVGVRQPDLGETPDDRYYGVAVDGGIVVHTHESSVKCWKRPY